MDRRQDRGEAEEAPRIKEAPIAGSRNPADNRLSGLGFEVRHLDCMLVVNGFPG
jgi:hypothetical protein